MGLARTLGTLLVLFTLAALGADPATRAAEPPEARAGTDWWSLQPPVETKLPDVADAGWAINPIDRFVLAKLEAAGLRPSPAADGRALVRRITFDLTGLPPTPEEVEEFVADASPDAYAKLVDRLLASPGYGQRWARHWLDVVRFGESHGFERDQLRPNAWRYRDWVIDALNADMPYDRFVKLQLAGDVIVLTPFISAAQGAIAALAVYFILMAGMANAVSTTVFPKFVQKEVVANLGGPESLLRRNPVLRHQ